MEDVVSETGLQEVENYVSRLQNTAAQVIATMPIMDLCMVVKRRPGSRVTKQWWDQEGLDLVGMRMAAQKAERTEGLQETDRTETEKETDEIGGRIISKHNLRGGA